VKSLLPHLAILLVTTAEGGMNTIMPPYLERERYGVEQIGFITALFALLQLASRLPVGAFYRGKRAPRLLVGFSLLYVFSTIGYAFSNHAVWVFSMTVLHGFAFGAVTTVMLPIAIQLKDMHASHGASMGWYTAALSAGYALGAFLSGYVAEHGGYAATFVIIGLLPLGTLLLSLLLPYIADEVSRTDTRTSRSGWRVALNALPSLSPMLLFATLVAFYINFLDDGFSTFFPLLGLSIGLTLVVIGTLKGIKSATGVVVRLFAGKIFKFVDFKLLNHVLVIGWSLAVFVLPGVRETWTFVALFVAMGLARSLSRVTSATLVAEEKAKDASGIGLASGIYNMGLDVGSLAGPLVAGYVARVTDVSTMMRVIPIVMVCLYFSALLWVQRAAAKRTILAVEALE
jgi:MFS family permease